MVQSFQKLILGKGTGLNERLLKSLSDKIGVYCPWFREEGSLDKETWDRVGEALRDAQADDLTLYLWELVKDAIEKDFVRILDSTQMEFGESPMRHPPERRFSEEGTLGPYLKECRDHEDELVLDGEVQTEKGATRCLTVGEHPPHESPPAPLRATCGREPTLLERQLNRLELEAKMQNLPNDYQDRRRVSDTGRNYSEFYRSPPERAVTLARGEAQNYSETRALPMVETTDQQDSRNKQYLKVIKDLRTAVAQCGPTAPYTLVLLENLTGSCLTPQDWKDLCQATLAGGECLLWQSKWQEISKRTADLNAQSGNPGWNAEMLLGEGRYASKASQVGLPAGVYNQIAAAARCAWKQLPAIGDSGKSVAHIRQGPDESYQNFVNRLLMAANRIRGDSQIENPVVIQLAYDNANEACRTALRPYIGQTDLKGYVRLCAEVGPALNQGFTCAAAMQGNSAQTSPSQNRGSNICFKCGSAGHLKRECPKGKGVKSGQTDRPPGICPRCQRGYHWSGKCKSRTDLQGRPLQGNGKRGPPQTPSHSQSAAYGATELQSGQGNLFSNSSKQPQEVRDWISVPPPTQY